MSFPPGPGFERLLQRLVRRLRSAVTNGEFTERGLARLTGISQPHLHHILSGKRSMTSHVADAILASVGWGIGDLLAEEEIDGIALERRSHRGARKRIPVLAGRIGLSVPFPETSEVQEWLLVSTQYCDGIRRAFLAGLEPDPAVPFARLAGGFALIAEDEELRLRLAPEDWFVLRWGGAGMVRRVRAEAGSLILLGQECLHGGGGVANIPVAGHTLLSVVRGRLLWAGPDPRAFDPFSYSGSGFPVATAS